MNLCKPHWDNLCSAIRERGMSHLISGSSQQLSTRLNAHLSGEPKEVSFDPLMAASFAIWGNALANCVDPNYLLREDVCPLCELGFSQSIHGGDGPLDWIEKAGDGALEEARKLGLVSRGTS